jgi:hypothetical protein
MVDKRNPLGFSDGRTFMAGNSSAAVGCLGLIGMVLIGSCIFGGGSSEKPAQAEPQAASQVESQTPSDATSNRSAPDAAAVSEAQGTVAFIIGLNGYHCIKVINTQDAGSGVYDVTCIIDHHGHQATYMVNSRTNDVAEI